ncbi:MAG: medium chain dehydrogenase/reductase family protein [Candidatus Bipolaricaulia bacterium]
MASKRNRRVVVTQYGDPDVLQVVTSETPEPAWGEVRIRVEATGLAFADILMREGLYPGTPSVPFAPGYDVVGVVDQRGEGVADWQPGDRVAALTVFGGYADYLTWPAADLVPVPDGLSAGEAVSLVLNGTTADQMLHRVASVQPGGRILVHGAAGGVGTLMLQLARLDDITVYGTASTPKHDLIRELDATPIDYRSQDFVERVHKLTNGEGVDAAFDPIGGANWRRSYRTLKRGGHLVTYGLSAALQARGRQRRLAMLTSMARLGWLKLLPDARRVSFYSITGLKAKHPAWFRDDLQNLFQLCGTGRIAPVIGESLPLERAGSGHDLLENARVSGKIVLQGLESASDDPSER